MFLNKNTKNSFEVRQTEAFRAASAAVNTMQTCRWNRPGIFICSIIDPGKNTSKEVYSFMKLFRVIIPNHAPAWEYGTAGFRRYGGVTSTLKAGDYIAKAWVRIGGYTTDPYQYMRALGERTPRDCFGCGSGHSCKGWTREQAIKYMVDNEPISEGAQSLK